MDSKSNLQNHWENVYKTKSPNQVSWTQNVPKSSLELIKACNAPKTASIIDVGAGDSLLVDFLLADGYQDLTVLDISAEAIKRAKKRLGPLAEKVTWVTTDIIDFKPTKNFDVWHDRAAFHFLTSDHQQKQYNYLLKQHAKDHLIVATFSKSGPEKCSGLNIQQYSEQSMSSLFKEMFKIQGCREEEHLTPFETIQNFIFCHFRRLS